MNIIKKVINVLKGLLAVLGIFGFYKLKLFLEVSSIYRRRNILLKQLKGLRFYHLQLELIWYSFFSGFEFFL